MYKSERLELRLSAREVQILDQVRGASTRSAWIRNQIAHAGGPDKETRLVTKRVDTPLADRIQPDPLQEAVPVDPAQPQGPAKAAPHLHRYTKKKIHHYSKGQEVYLRECACGDQKIE
jgi:hypothetical protein